MSDTNTPLKLKLKSTDTNRFKVANDEAAKADAAASEVQDTNASATQQVVDPISLRDTATGKLRKIAENQDAQAAAPAMTMASTAKTQTVRLKVVRQDSKTMSAQAPQAARPALSLQEQTVEAKPMAGVASPSATQAVTPPAAPAERPSLKLNLNKAAADNATVVTSAAHVDAAKPMAPTPDKTSTVTLKRTQEPAASSQEVKLAAPASASAAATVKLAMPSMSKPATPAPAKPASAAAPKPAPTLAKTSAVPAPAAPAVEPSAEPVEEPAKSEAIPQEIGFAPKAAPVAIAPLVSIPTIVACVALIGVVVFDVLMYLQMLK